MTRNAGRASPVVRVLPGSLDSHWQAGRTEHRQPARPDSDFESDSRPGHSSGSGRRRDGRAASVAARARLGPRLGLGGVTMCFRAAEPDSGSQLGCTVTGTQPQGP